MLYWLLKILLYLGGTSFTCLVLSYRLGMVLLLLLFNINWFIIRIYDMEIRLQTPEKFLHPSYETLCWYAAKNYHNELLSKRVLSPSLCLFFFLGNIQDSSPPSHYLFNGLISLTESLYNWMNNKEVLYMHALALWPSLSLPFLLVSGVSSLVHSTKC